MFSKYPKLQEQWEEMVAWTAAHSVSGPISADDIDLPITSDEMAPVWVKLEKIESFDLFQFINAIEQARSGAAYEPDKKRPGDLKKWIKNVRHHAIALAELLEGSRLDAELGNELHDWISPAPEEAKSNHRVTQVAIASIAPYRPIPYWYGSQYLYKLAGQNEAGIEKSGEYPKKMHVPRRRNSGVKQDYSPQLRRFSFAISEYFIHLTEGQPKREIVQTLIEVLYGVHVEPKQIAKWENPEGYTVKKHDN
jgi:hypothetical protein